jgi:LysM repeat protein
MAAPAVAVAGAFAAAGPQALAATVQTAHVAAAVKPAAVQAVAAHLESAVQQQASRPNRVYTVRSGNTLSGIAQQFYGHASDWPYLFHVNKSRISDPNLIYPGQEFRVPTNPPASVLNGTYHGRHAATSSGSNGGGATSTSQSSGGQSSSGSTSTSQSGGGQSSGSGSTSLSADVQQDISNGNNLLAVAQYMVENGYSDAAAAGIASCVDGESGGNPESVGSGGGGLIGWTPIGSAAPNSNIITGDVEQDMMNQLEDILFYNSNEIGQSAIDQLNGISDPVEAADFYSQNFEKPAVTDSDVVPSVAEQIFSQLTSLRLPAGAAGPSPGTSGRPPRAASHPGGCPGAALLSLLSRRPPPIAAGRRRLPWHRRPPAPRRPRGNPGSTARPASPRAGQRPGWRS